MGTLLEQDRKSSQTQHHKHLLHAFKQLKGHGSCVMRWLDMAVISDSHTKWQPRLQVANIHSCTTAWTIKDINTGDWILVIYSASLAKDILLYIIFWKKTKKKKIANAAKIAKFMNVFFLEWFPLYSILNMARGWKTKDMVVENQD